MRPFADIYRGQKVLVTGHTGFKGSWLCLWLRELGAQVVGYALPPPTEPNHFQLLNLDMESNFGDIRDLNALFNTVKRTNPVAVFHLAAQPLVRRSYREPVDTFTTNILGTVNILEACRNCDSVRAIISVTSDKVYENRESTIPYVEEDNLGGSDPYSSSKSCAELVTSSYRQSYFHPNDFGTKHHVLLASARAGNVIGGGDWAEDRLIPDAVRAASRGETIVIRNPRSIRPWQHVLEPLAGYLALGQKLLEGRTSFAEAWNFGPDDEGNVEVGNIIDRLVQVWPAIRSDGDMGPAGPHETKILKLNSAKAQRSLGWRPVWGWQEAVDRAGNWYRRQHEGKGIASHTDLSDYVTTAAKLGAGWVSA